MSYKVERDYIKSIYSNKDFYSKIGQNAAILNSEPYCRRNINNFHSQLYSLLSNYNDKKSSCTDTDLDSIVDNESVQTSLDIESQSLMSSLSRLGVESASVETLKHLRNNSYLKSVELESIDTLLLKFPTQSIPQPPPPPPPPQPTSLPPPPATTDKKTTPEDASITKKTVLKACTNIFSLMKPINSNGSTYLIWLALVSLSYIYNIFGITIRLTFDFDDNNELDDENGNNPIISSLYLNKTNESNNTNLMSGFMENKDFYWFLLDYSADLIYLIDTFFIQTRLEFLNDGLWISDLKSTAIKFFKSPKFILDILSVLPFDLIQIFTGITPLTRLNRVLKLHILLEFFDRWDRAVQSFIFVVRLIRLFVYLQIVIHLYSCVYYKLSSWETKVKKVNNDWVYQIKHTKINKFVFAYLFGLKTASTIGNNPQPYTREEYLFTAISSLVALFLFALIVGQIRNIIGSLSTKQDAFLIVVDTTTKFVKQLNLPKSTFKKVGLWFEYYIKEQNDVPFEAIEFLPVNVQTDLAISVYLDLISKVKLFQECEKNLLYALVLKLKPKTFMPGDYICRKGEVGREMFIVNSGVVEVIVDNKAVAQMKVGSYFGEISLLSVGHGGNRRTANVVSKGFSSLLVLHKTDFNAILSDYPEMKKVLKKTADSYLKKK